MSAFICSDETFCAIATFGRKVINADARTIIDRLHAANRLGVSERYADAGISADAVTFKPIEVSPVQILKSCACLEYQCCDSESWQASPAREMLEAIRSAAIRALPGYAAAAWDL